MKKFVVEMMTVESYGAYMCGGHDYHVRKEIVNADNAEEAIAFAKLHYPNLVINENYVKEVE